LVDVMNITSGITINADAYCDNKKTRYKTKNTYCPKMTHPILSLLNYLSVPEESALISKGRLLFLRK
jgi:hypothetical protein